MISPAYPTELVFADIEAMHTGIKDYQRARPSDSLVEHARRALQGDAKIASALAAGESLGLPEHLAHGLQEPPAEAAGAAAGMDAVASTKCAVSFDFVVDTATLAALSRSRLGRAITSLAFDLEWSDEAERAEPLDFSGIVFPSLESLSVSTQPIEAIEFDLSTTPRLSSLTIDNPINRQLATFKTNLPELRFVSLQFVTLEDPTHFGSSLSRSPKLEAFHAYKLWGLGIGSEHLAHRLLLPAVAEFDVYRSDDLDHLIMWAPKLTELNLQACYGIESVTITNCPETVMKSFPTAALPEAASPTIVRPFSEADLARDPATRGRWAAFRLISPTRERPERNPVAA